jgi:hypothetical protein
MSVLEVAPNVDSRSSDVNHHYALVSILWDVYFLKSKL